MPALASDIGTFLSGQPIGRFFICAQRCAVQGIGHCIWLLAANLLAFFSNSDRCVDPSMSMDMCVSAAIAEFLLVPHSSAQHTESVMHKVGSVLSKKQLGNCRNISSQHDPGKIRESEKSQEILLTGKYQVIRLKIL